MDLLYFIFWQVCATETYKYICQNRTFYKFSVMNDWINLKLHFQNEQNIYIKSFNCDVGWLCNIVVNHNWMEERFFLCGKGSLLFSSKTKVFPTSLLIYKCDMETCQKQSKFLVNATLNSQKTHCHAEMFGQAQI